MGLREMLQALCYLPGCYANVSPLITVPPNLSSSLSRPDLVLVFNHWFPTNSFCHTFFLL